MPDLSCQTSRIDNGCGFGEVNLDQLFTGNGRNDIRVAQVLHRWDNGQYVDPPNIFYSKQYNKMLFGDGCYRTKTAYLLENE